MADKNDVLGIGIKPAPPMTGKYIAIQADEVKSQLNIFTSQDMTPQEASMLLINALIHTLGNAFKEKKDDSRIIPAPGILIPK